MSANSPGRSYLVYGDNGMQLVYEGEDAADFDRICSELQHRSVGHLSGYQFVGRRRFELRAYFNHAPSDAFLQARHKRDLFDFAWISHGEAMD